MRIASRGQVEPFHVMEVLKAAALRQATHGDVLSLCAGQPSTPAPAPVLRAAQAALGREVLGYTETTGIRPLREAIAAHYAAEYGVGVDPDEVIVTTGSSGAFTAVFLAAYEVGDLVAMARPGYPAYRNTLQALGCRVLELDCGEEVRFQPTVAMLEALPEVPAGLILASPANPTGTVIDPAELAAIAAWCEEHDCLLISDEIYHGVSYVGRCASVLESTRSAVAVGSFSKYFSMTGWRIGWMVVPPWLTRSCELLLGNLNICAPAVAQVAAVAAFTPQSRAEVDGHVRRYAVNRDLLLAALPGLGLGHIAPPDGAFYVYADLAPVLGRGEGLAAATDSLAWCSALLDATGVALTPGVDFAPAREGEAATANGLTRVRLSFAGSTADLEEALDRLAGVLG